LFFVFVLFPKGEINLPIISLSLSLFFFLSFKKEAPNTHTEERRKKREERREKKWKARELFARTKTTSCESSICSSGNAEEKTKTKIKLVKIVSASMIIETRRRRLLRLFQRLMIFFFLFPRATER
jgi:hypothetical protein